ncbi:MAG: VaFE repeat-containing surface-anchored protein, partial [Eubacteriales bacterium]|nr:VaFE repeat-containing surface-anchored protein [Eubacteriales bacterium]
TPQNPDGPENPDDPGEPLPSGPPIAVHEDPEDEDQTIYYPKIRTFAAGEDDESKTLTAEGLITIRDRVVWENLLPGYTYRLKGSLMRKDTGDPLMAGEEAVTASAVFTPETPDGETFVLFSFGASDILPEKSAAAGREGDSETAADEDGTEAGAGATADESSAETEEATEED